VSADPARRARARRAILLSLALVAAGVFGGCASSDDRPGAKAISIPRAKKGEAGGGGGGSAAAPEPKGPTQQEIDDALAQMSSAIQHGDHERAVAIADSILKKEPPEEARQQIDRLRKAARQHLLQTFYVDAVVRAGKERVTIGDPIVGEVVLINIGTDPVVIEDEKTGGGASSRTLLHLEVAYREFAPDGTLVRDLLTSNVLLGKRITIAPTQRYSIPLKLDTLEQNPGGTMLRQYDIGGSVFLAEMKTGKETIYGQLTLKPHRVRVFPRNYEHLADKPVARLADAIRRRSPDHIPLAAALVADSQKNEALAVLRDGLREPASSGIDVATQRACCVALSVITDEDRKPEPQEWLKRLGELLP
jgi:hypothetical protein